MYTLIAFVVDNVFFVRFGLSRKLLAKRFNHSLRLFNQTLL